MIRPRFRLAPANLANTAVDKSLVHDSIWELKLSTIRPAPLDSLFIMEDCGSDLPQFFSNECRHVSLLLHDAQQRAQLFRSILAWRFLGLGNGGTQLQEFGVNRG
jgi:hypothetical protein